MIATTVEQITPLDHERLRGSVALVTGAGRGIGQLTARALARSGAAVALLARSSDELAGAVASIEADGGVATAATADVTDAARLAAAVADIRRQLGPIDILVNNAGIIGPIGPLWEVDPDAWWSTFDVNLRGVALTSQLVLPDMVAAGRGRIINITSQAGAHRWPLVSAYSVSKAAVVKLTENLALEASRHGISVFSFHPGLLPIGLTESFFATVPTTIHEAHVQRWTIEEFAAGRFALPDRAVELLMRLAAGDADALSGRHLSVDDDLDAVLARRSDVAARDLYVMRPERLHPIASSR